MLTSKLLTTPVLFLIFNRPDTTQRVFDEIKKARPSQLFVSADGPREGKAGEAARCQAARDVIKQVDWECEVHKNFHEKNVGLKIAVSSGIDWFFKHVEEGIILEDDCLPSQSFFWFCQKLLERYRDDKRIMMIGGSNLQFGRKRGSASYYFSRLAHIWGWASLKRAWKYFDLNLETFPDFKEQNQIQNVFVDKTSQIFWMTKIQKAYAGGNSWAYLWAYTIMAQNGLCICPNENLVSNIGFRPDATHRAASDINNPLGYIKTVEIEQIIHPTYILPDRSADEFLSASLTRLQLPRISFGTTMKTGIMGVAMTMIPKACRKKVRSLIERCKSR